MRERHVRIIDAAREAAAEAQMHHPLEPVVVSGEQGPERFLVAAGGPA